MRQVIGALGVVALVVAGTVPGPSGLVVERSARVQLAATSLIMPGTKIGNVLDPQDFVAYAQGFIAQTTGGSPDPIFIPVPGEFWPATGLNSPTFDQSVDAGHAMLVENIDQNGENVVFGHSQSAVIATKEKRRLIDTYGTGADAPDVTFVLVANPNTPNGGLLARFPGLYIPILDVKFTGATPTGDEGGPYQTHNIIREFDGWTDFPAYPLNVVAVANAVLGIYYLHDGYYDLDPEILADPDRTMVSTHGDTTYYFVKTEIVPLLQPLVDLGVPKELVKNVDPYVRYVVELGYDRDRSFGAPTPARLFPPINVDALEPEPESTPEPEPDNAALKPMADDVRDSGDQPEAATKQRTLKRPERATPQPIIRESLRAVTTPVRDGLPKSNRKAESSTPQEVSETTPDTTDTDDDSDATD